MDKESVFISSPFLLISHKYPSPVCFKATYYKSSELSPCEREMYIQLEDRSCCITNTF